MLSITTPDMAGDAVIDLSGKKYPYEVYAVANLLIGQ